jgi:hypothetical protein
MGMTQVIQTLLSKLSMNLSDPVVAGEVAYFNDAKKAEQWLEL